MGWKRAQSFALATFGTASLTADNGLRRSVLFGLDAKVANVKGNCARALVKLARYCGLRHARGEHLPDALPKLGLCKMVGVGH